MALASTGKELEAAEDSSAEPIPIDVDAISIRTESILGMRMGTTTRKEMDNALAGVTRNLDQLLCQDLGADGDEDVRTLFRKGYALFARETRPTAETPAFGVFTHLRDTALLTRQLLWIYTQRNGLESP
ncbi:hypothetical protein [Streptomyces viridochromogenes]|uniref:hypothetical protein n=1 Tax=Streptomyces viridochromogenes TaxID=1938 RepID=UPI000AD63F3F|nr:hypothetical protein [Streptomyces viridochromogenes]